MAQGDGRSRAGRGRLNKGSGDPRSSERARSIRRSSDRTSTRRSPVSVIETGEQEIHPDDLDLVDEIAPPEISDSDAGSATAPASKTARPARRNRRTRSTTSILTRLRSIDAKRAVVLALVIGVVALALAPSLRNYYSQRSEYNQVIASNSELRSQITDYQQKVNEQGDPARIEAEARARLGLVKPGETPLVMMFPDDEKRAAEQEREAQRAQNPWYGTKGGLWGSIANPADDK